MSELPRKHTEMPYPRPAITEAILKERGATHGDFKSVATTEQLLKASLRTGSNWNTLPDAMKCALEMMAHKTARILEGDPRHKDHWDDIEGYSRCVSRDLV